MKNRMIALGSLIAVLGTTAAYGVFAQGNTTPVPPVAGKGKINGIRRHRDNDRDPAMHRALRNLEQAKNSLQRAEHEFGGHRAKALQMTEQAIREVREGLKYDNNRDK